MKRKRGGDQACTFSFIYLMDCSGLLFGVFPLFTNGDTLVGKPAIEFSKTCESWTWNEKPFPDVLYLVLNLSFLPSRAGSAGNWFDKIMAAHLQKSGVELPFFPSKNPVYRCFKIIVNAAFARPPEKLEGFIMRIKNHLLAFTGVGNNIELPAVAESEMRDLDCLWDTCQNDVLVAPVKLIGFSRRKLQRDIALFRFT